MVAIWLAILPKWERLAFISSNIKYYGVFIYSQKKLFYQYYYHFNYQPYKVVKRTPTICQQQLTNCSSIFWPFDEVYLKGCYPLRKVSKYGVISGPNTGKYGPEITPYLDTFHAVSQSERYLGLCQKAINSSGIILKMVKHTLKILRCEYRKISKYIWPFYNIVHKKHKETFAIIVNGYKGKTLLEF